MSSTWARWDPSIGHPPGPDGIHPYVIHLGQMGSIHMSSTWARWDPSICHPPGPDGIHPYVIHLGQMGSIHMSSTWARWDPSICHPPGPDGIHPYVLRELAAETAYPVCKLYNSSLEEDALPEYWTTATVTPIFKKGENKDPTNYRPVSLTSVLCKVTEKLVRNNIISKYQHGFVKGRSCVTHFLEVMDEWLPRWRNGQVSTSSTWLQKGFRLGPSQPLRLQTECTWCTRKNTEMDRSIPDWMIAKSAGERTQLYTCSSHKWHPTRKCTGYHFLCNTHQRPAEGTEQHSEAIRRRHETVCKKWHCPD